MNIKYRPEIDGLRAISVIAVIIYHAQIEIFNFKVFQGGFIGVDIFFVISGYLITSIILKELISTKKFSFTFFYERRVRRILPVLILVMLFSLPLSWIYMKQISLIDFSNSILYSLGFNSNFYFWFTGEAYNAENSLFKPLLHTWSLSIEEQYYIIFPLILLILYKNLKNYIGLIFILVFFISLGLAEYGSKNHSSFNFYMLPTRAWELVAGSLLAYAESIKLTKFNNKIVTNLFPSVGIILIIHALFFFNHEVRHPSVYTLSPIIGICLIIWFSNKKEIITKIISSKLLVGIGLISYSLYLWHYPIFAFARYENLFNNNYLKIIFVVIVILLSLFSYFLIETPARNRKLKFRNIILVCILSYIFLIITQSKIISNNGYPNRLPEILRNTSVDPLTLLKNSKNEQCFNNKKLCTFNTSSNKKLFLIGDSHAGQLAFDLKNQLLDRNYQFISSSIGGCVYFPSFDRVNIKTQKIDSKCNKEYFSNLKEILDTEKNSIIIFSGRFSLYLNNAFFDNKEGGIENKVWQERFVSNSEFQNFQESFRNSILSLSQNNKIILIYPIPEVGFNVPDRLMNLFPKRLNHIKKTEDILKKENFLTTSYKVFKDRNAKHFELFDSIKSQNIYRVFPHKLFCNTVIKERCLTHNLKNLFYFDDDHLSLKATKLVNRLILQKIKTIESKNKTK